MKPHWRTFVMIQFVPLLTWVAITTQLAVN